MFRTLIARLAQKATHEIQEHPIASLAAATTAAAALIGVIVAINRTVD